MSKQLFTQIGARKETSQHHFLKVKCDHRSKFSNLSNWKEEA